MMTAMEWQYDPATGSFSSEGKGTSFAMDLPAYTQFTFNAGNLNAVSRPAQFGDFSESLALLDRRRPHVSENGDEVSLDAASPIPFGTEPKVERTFRYDGDSLAVVTTFVLRHSFQMRSINAGGLEFSGDIVRVGIAALPEVSGEVPSCTESSFADFADGAVLFDSHCPPLRLVMTASDGTALEFELGETVWRWINAGRISGKSRFSLTKQDGRVIFDWQLYTFVPETEESTPPDGRDWRLHYRLIRHSGTKQKITAADCKAFFDAAAEKWQKQALVSGRKEVCFASAAALNTLKKWVRQQFADAQEGDIFGIRNATESVCYSAAHMDRAKLKDLPHWDAPSIAEFVRWGNRQLSRYGAKLVIVNE